MPICKHQFLAACFLALISTSSSLQAADGLPSEFDIRFSGFGTLGVAHSDDELLGFRRDLSREGVSDGDWKLKTDSLLGLQADLRLNRSVSASIQLVGKDRADNSLINSVEWAYVRFQPSRNTVFNVGRVGFEVFLLSEYRNLGFAYLWARPPAEFYGALAFNYLDGVDAGYSTSFGGGTIRLKAFAGVTKNSFAAAGNDPIEIDIDPIFGGNVSWENNDWRVLLGVASLEVSSSIGPTQLLTDALQQVAPLWPEANVIATGMEAKGGHLRYLSGGLTYTNNAWVIQSELEYIHSSLKQFDSIFSSYLSAGYDIGATTFFVMGAVARNANDRGLLPDAPPIPQIQILRGEIQNFYDFTRIKQHSLSLGLRWDINYNLALKTQWDHAWVKKYGGGLFDQTTAITSARGINTFSISLDFIFR